MREGFSDVAVRALVLVALGMDVQVGRLVGGIGVWVGSSIMGGVVSKGVLVAGSNFVLVGVSINTTTGKVCSG